MTTDLRDKAMALKRAMFEAREERDEARAERDRLRAERDAARAEVMAELLDARRRVSSLEVAAQRNDTAWLAAQRRSEKAEQAVARVRELHQPFPDDGVQYCGWDRVGGCGEAWPCPTIRALDGDGGAS